jgi:Ser/Thr protein kinase RdoA (MazF antagonist)
MKPDARRARPFRGARANSKRRGYHRDLLVYDRRVEHFISLPSYASAVQNCAKMWPVGWEALRQWGKDVARVERLAGGVANDVWSVRVNGQLAVGRLGTRSDADLAWETQLLQHLDREGLTVPVPIPTMDGRQFVDGLVVMTYMEGGPPETEGDWRRVADTLRQLHRLTQGWPQRPGWRSSTDLLHAETGTKIDLNAMPPEGVARCRAAWARLIGHPVCVVHGNPNNPGNVRMTADRVALIDWDESHVDVPDLDLVLPQNAAGLEEGAYDIAAQASAAWEAAVCWKDEYAVKRLAEVRAV